MSIQYEIDSGRHLIHTRCAGPVTLPEVLEHFRALGADPGIGGALDVLLDFSDLTTFPSSDQVQSVAYRIRDLMPKIAWRHCAVVAPRDVAFGIGRMFEMLSDRYFRATMVFRRLDEAEHWLARGRADADSTA
jgi:hypothetical protein